MGRGMLIESGLPNFLWTYAIMPATHIRNCCYVKRIKATPCGLITGVKPNVAKWHIFGTICYACLHGQTKLDPHSRKGHFIGYDRNSLAYLVYYPENRTVVKHRLVKFTDQFENKETMDVVNDLFPSQFDNAHEDIATELETQHDEPNAELHRRASRSPG